MIDERTEQTITFPVKTYFTKEHFETMRIGLENYVMA